MIVEALDLIESGKAVYIPQNHAEATHVKMLTKEDGEIDWSKTGREISNLVRGMNPWPSAFTHYLGKTLKIWGVEYFHEGVDCEAGTILFSDLKNGIKVACGDGVVEIKELQLEGAKRMSARDFLLGRTFDVGGKFTNA
jgi:methionyl-tRNA formyltransferase